MPFVSDFLYMAISMFVFAFALGLFFFFWSEKNQTGMLWALFITWVAMGAAILLYANTKLNIEPEHMGLLTPAADPDPDPEMQTRLPKGALRLYLGSCVAVSTGGPMVALKVGGEPVVSIRRDGEAISVSAKLYSKDRRIIAEIADNEFHLNPNNYFRKERPSKSELVVYDQSGAEVLRAKYLNSKAIKITGVFQSDAGFVRCDDNGIYSSSNGGTFHRVEARDLNVGFSIDKPGRPPAAP